MASTGGRCHVGAYQRATTSRLVTSTSRLPIGAYLVSDGRPGPLVFFRLRSAGVLVAWSAAAPLVAWDTAGLLAADVAGEVFA